MPKKTEANTQAIDLELADILEAENVAELLNEEQRSLIASRVCSDFDSDYTQLKPKLNCIDEAMSMAMLEKQVKNYPWPNASNIKLPILSEASISFAQMAYPAIFQNGKIAKGVAIGDDSGVFQVMPDGSTQVIVPEGAKRQRADRVARFQNWQLTSENSDWEEQTDALVHALPITGYMIRKVFFDPISGTNKTALRFPKQCIPAYNSKSTQSAPRMTDTFELFGYEISERIRGGIFVDFDYRQGLEDIDDGEVHSFYEQHRTLDLDNDGYPEPYVVTVHEKTKELVRIVPRFSVEDVEYNRDGEVSRIEATNHFVVYSFMPSPDGSIGGLGLGELLLPLNESANTSVNQLIDAGHKSIAGGGLIGSGARLRKGTIKAEIGKWTHVDAKGDDLRRNMIPLDTPAPSGVLFELLGFVVQTAKNLAGTTKVITGGNDAAPQAALTTMEMVEEGSRAFKAVYRRIHRALGQELKIHYKLNSRHLEEAKYQMVMDTDMAQPEDFNAGDFDIMPVSDPNVANESQRLGRIRFLLSLKDDPRMNGGRILEEALRSVNVENTEEFLAPPPSGEPSPEQLMLAQEMENRKRELDIKEAKIMTDAMKSQIENAKTAEEIQEIRAKIDNLNARSIESLAQAEAEEEGRQLDSYKQEMKNLNAANR